MSAASPGRAGRFQTPGPVEVTLFLLVLVLPGVGWGDVAISLPLEGHYRPGRYMPVRLVATGERGAVTLTGDGTLPTELRPSANADVVLPWLIVSESVGEAHWNSSKSGERTLPLPLRALGDHERLVAFAGDESDIAQSLFPGETIVPVALDLARPLLEPPQAWEALDGVVLSAAAAARLDDGQRGMLAAAGTVLAVRSSQPPDARWPWKRIGDYWVLRYVPAGPQSVVEPAAYVPTYEWQRGWPISFRRQVIFAAVLFCILAVAVTLWRSRLAVAWFLVLSGATAGAFAAWYARQSPVLQLTAGVMTETESIAQYDLWTWQSPVRAGTASFPATGLTHPVLGTDRQLEQTGIRLVCRSDGAPDQFVSHLAPGQSMAFLTRLLRGGLPQVPLRPLSRPLNEFAEELYLRPGDQIAGQFSLTNPYTSEPTPVVIVHRPGE